MNPFLSIAIPTFNRPEEVKKRLLQLAELDVSIQNQIEVLICDNGAKRIDLKNLPISNLKIRHHIQERNLGLGSNINSCILLSTGEFTWLVSDDDEIQVQNFGELIQNLKNLPLDLMLLDDNAGEKTLSAQDNLTNRDSQWQKSIFISACIFRTQVAQRTIRILDGRVNPTYQQVLISILILQESDKQTNLWENLFVKDTLTHKNYNYKAAIEVRVTHFMLLEKQLLGIGLSTIQLKNLSNYINSNLISYTFQLLFEFDERRIYRHYMRTICVANHSCFLSKKRFLAIMFSLIAFSLGLVRPVFARYMVKNTYRLLWKKMPTIGTKKSSQFEDLNSASSIGYGNE